MRETVHSIPGRGPGTTHALHVFAFGEDGARPHVHVQGGLHADEGPGMMAARRLIDLLGPAEAEGRLRGRVTVVPAANPVGLGQFLHGDQSGRFDLADGRNFNRDYPDLAPAAARMAARLSPDPALNAVLIRAALAAELANLHPTDPTDQLRHRLLALALPADVVLDLHCDGEAEVHLYTHPRCFDRLAPLAALLGCRAVLLAEQSGGAPFDEALSRPWADLATLLSGNAVPQGCASCTVELRGRSDVTRDTGLQDARAIMGFLAHLGVLSDTPPALPAPLCTPTPLAGSEALAAPVAGLLSYVAALGTTVAKGDLVAEITHPLTGGVTPVRAGTTGVFYARPATRIAEAGKRLGKIAGTRAFRDGPLLSP